LVKTFRSIGTQLDDEQYGKLIQICKEQGCTPYYVIKDLLQQYIEIYEWAVKEEMEKEKQNEVEEQTNLEHTNSDDSKNENIDDNDGNNKTALIRIVP